MIERHPSETELNDWVDGLLDGPAGEEVRRHLEHCATCRESDRELRSLLDRVAELPEVPPRRDLLPDIQATVSERGRRSMPWLAIAASLLVVAAAAVAVVTWQSGDGVGAASQAALPEARASEEAAAVAELLEAEQEFAQATRKLLDVLAERRDLLQPETLAAVERDLAALDQAIRDTRVATARGAHSGQTLTALYQKKMEILRTVSRLTS